MGETPCDPSRKVEGCIMRLKTVDAARGKWHGILVELGMDPAYLTGKHTPCPFCGGKDRWRFDDKNGDGTWICGRCDEAGNGMQLAQKWTGMDFHEAAKQVDEILGNVDIQPRKPQPQKDPAIRLRQIQKGAKRINGSDPASMYLINRGVYADAKLNYHPGLTYFEDGKPLGKFAAMLGLVQSPEGVPLTWHVTHLQDGRKADVPAVKKIMKPVADINGAAIRLFDIAPRIGVAEGIETALAAFHLTGVPTWAVMNANGMKSFAPPRGVKEVVVFADNDKNYAGQKAAYDLAHRLALKMRVDVWIPQTCGDDWADVLGARLAAKSA